MVQSSYFKKKFLYIISAFKINVFTYLRILLKISRIKQLNKDSEILKKFLDSIAQPQFLCKVTFSIFKTVLI